MPTDEQIRDLAQRLCGVNEHVDLDYPLVLDPDEDRWFLDEGWSPERVARFIAEQGWAPAPTTGVGTQ